MKNTIKPLLIINICISITINIVFVIFFRYIKWYYQLIFYILNTIIIFLYFLFYLKNKVSLTRIFFILNMIVFLILIFFVILKTTGILENLTDENKLKEILVKYKTLGYIIFFFLEILNIVILPIPALVLHIVGASIFGALVGSIIAFSGVFIGSLIAFYIGRTFGKNLVIWCFGEELTEKYRKILNKNGKIAFIFMQLLPFFPDDILCFVAGISAMTWKFFIMTMLILRPIYIIGACYFGTGQIIPFSGWGIPVWILIFFFFLILCYLYYKNKSKIEKWLIKIKSSKKYKTNKIAKRN